MTMNADPVPHTLADFKASFFDASRRPLTEQDIFDAGVRSGLARGADVLGEAVRDVITERQRQMSVEGWTPEHDDQHDMGEMAHAAAWYSIDQMMRNALDERGLSFWPWAQEWWKPTTPRRDLVKAGALILAEIERIDRAEPGTCFFCSQSMSGTHEIDCPQNSVPSTGDQS